MTSREGDDFEHKTGQTTPLQTQTTEHSHYTGCFPDTTSSITTNLRQPSSSALKKFITNLDQTSARFLNIHTCSNMHILQIDIHHLKMRQLAMEQ